MTTLTRSGRRGRAGARALRAGFIPILAALVATTLSSGCFSYMKRTELMLDETVRNTRELQSRQSELAKEVADIRAILDSEGMVNDERRAELLTRLRVLEQTIEQMDARAQEQEALMRRMSASLDQLTRQSWPPAAPGGDSGAAPAPGQSALPGSDIPPPAVAGDQASHAADTSGGEWVSVNRAGQGSLPADTSGGEWVPVSGAGGESLPADTSGGEWVAMNEAERRTQPSDTSGGEWFEMNEAGSESIPADTSGGDWMNAGGSAADSAGGSPELVIYDAAVRDFARGSYALAREGFEELLRRFPRSQLADNAAFWLAETLFAEGQFQQSLARYERLLRDYPWTDVRLSALLKTGYCQLELGNTSGAVRAFKQLVREDPLSDEAAIAEHKLEAMGESGAGPGNPE